jgi:hypothetical protein
LDEIGESLPYLHLDLVAFHFSPILLARFNTCENPLQRDSLVYRREYQAISIIIEQAKFTQFGHMLPALQIIPVGYWPNGDFEYLVWLVT